MTANTTRSSRARARASAQSKSANGDSAASGLSEARIVQVAAEMIGESGTESLTMRALSDRLGVALGATYHHVPNREALLWLVTRDIASRVSLPDPDRDEWLAATRDLIIGYFTIFTQYRGVVGYLFNGQQDDQADRVADVVARLFANAGFGKRSADSVRAALFFYLRGAFLDADTSVVPADLAPRAFKDGLEILLKGAKTQLEEDIARRAARSRGTSRPKSSR